MKKELSIIIVNYKSREFLTKCVSSVFQSLKSVVFEIIIVNNDEKNISFTEDLSNKENVRIINLGANNGFGTACNAGAKIAQGEILLFFNPDAEMIPGGIKALMDQFSSNLKIGIIGPKLLTEDDKAQEWSAGEEVTLPVLIRNNLGFLAGKKTWESPEKTSCAWVSGAALFIRKNLFDRLQGFDKKFFMYFEDIDLCRRARQAGSEVIYFPSFKVRHLGGKSFIEKDVQKKYYYDSQDRYFQKYFSKTTGLMVKVLRRIFS